MSAEAWATTANHTARSVRVLAITAGWGLLNINHKFMISWDYPTSRPSDEGYVVNAGSFGAATHWKEYAARLVRRHAGIQGIEPAWSSTVICASVESSRMVSSGKWQLNWL